MGFRESFGSAYVLAVERVKLARKFNFDNESLLSSRMVFYIKRKKDFDSSGKTFREAMGDICGYALGTYTTFCSTQSRLNRFDGIANDRRWRIGELEALKS